MKKVTEEEFQAFIGSMAQDDLTCGHDVGRTHGITCHYNMGKLVAVERWVRDLGHPRVWTYEIAA